MGEGEGAGNTLERRDCDFGQQSSQDEELMDKIKGYNKRKIEEK